jgi:UDP-glucose 4-epimerase
LRTNVDGTRNLLEGLRPGAHFVFVSSAAVYGHATRVPVGEDEPPKPLSPYGESKVTGEHLTQEIAKRRGASWTVVRPFNMYSETQETTNAYTGAIWKFVQAARAGAPLRIHGDGLQTRDFIHASDVARLLWACVIEERARSVTMNAGTGQGMKVLDLARTIVRLCGSRSPIIHADAIAGEVRHSVARCDVARSLGWTPTVGLEEGLQRVLARPDLPT